MFEVLSVRGSAIVKVATEDNRLVTYDKTFEKSLDGDITKLSLEFDQDMRCRML